MRFSRRLAIEERGDFAANIVDKALRSAAERLERKARAGGMHCRYCRRWSRLFSSNMYVLNICHGLKIKYLMFINPFLNGRNP
jgi:hypothetical protein